MKISNYTELKSEIARLEGLSKNQELKLLEKVHSIRESLRPSNLIINSLASITGIPINKNQVIKKGALIALTYIFQRYFHKTELKFENLLSSIISEIKRKLQDMFRSEEVKENEVHDQGQDQA